MHSAHGFLRNQPIPNNYFMKTPQFTANSVETNGASKFLAQESGFNSSLFTTKRIWVKFGQGNPTTIQVHQNDIVDDLKSLVRVKYPNSIGRTFDSADLIIKLDLQSRSSLNVTSNKKQAQANLSVSPDRKSPISPLFNLSMGRYLPLEPDQNVCSILDTYYPNGMSMSEAFIIDTPDVSQPMSQPNSQAQYQTQYQPQYQPPYQPQYQSQYPYQPQPQSQPQAQSQSQNQAQMPPHYQKPGQIPQNSSPSYHQPKPQYTIHKHLNSGGSISMNSGIDEVSLSPASLNANNRLSPIYRQQSPVPRATLHRRSQSNPPQSPASQAVLLLPKNFSLTGSNAVNPLTKKRLSLDERQVKEINESDKLTNINTDQTLTTDTPAPFPLSINRKAKTLPKLQVSQAELSATNSSPESPATSASAKELNVPKGSHELNSPTRTPTTATYKTKNLDDANELEKEETSPTENKSNLNYNGDKSINKGKSANQSSNNNNNGKRTGNNSANGTSTSNQKNKSNQPPKNSVESLTKSARASTTEKVLPSISVLVVEDNAINQAILGAFLRKHKIHYQIAKNGQEAIDKWRTGGFHLVLMDIQLPVKSGIEATKAIRRLEKINKIGVFAQSELNNNQVTEIKEDEKLEMETFRSPVIIVALTASSNSSVDRQNALMAGCNDYLTKPVNLVWLQNKITEWGCMQALIDFDGWKSKSLTFKQKEKPSHKVAT